MGLMGLAAVKSWRVGTSGMIFTMLYYADSAPLVAILTNVTFNLFVGAPTPAAAGVGLRAASRSKTRRAIPRKVLSIITLAGNLGEIRPARYYYHYRGRYRAGKFAPSPNRPGQW